MIFRYSKLLVVLLNCLCIAIETDQQIVSVLKLCNKISRHKRHVLSPYSLAILGSRLRFYIHVCREPRSTQLRIKAWLLEKFYSSGGSRV